MARRKTIFWALVLPLGAASVSAVDKLTARLSAAAPSAKEISDQILPAVASSCTPEPQEHAQFMLAITIPICLAFFVTVGLRAFGVFRKSESCHPALSLLAFASQLCVAYVGWKALVVQGSEVFGYRFFAFGPTFGAILLVGLVMTFAHLYPAPSWPIRAFCQKAMRTWWLPWLLAVTWIVMFAITGVFRWEEIAIAPFTLRHHIPVTMGEFAAAVNGRFPLVDFYSQYQNLQCLLVKPIFEIFGFGVGSYSIVMFLFTVSAFAFLYAALCRIFESRWIALALFVPFVALAYYAAEAKGNEYVGNLSTYFAAGSTRYFCVGLLAWCASWYLGRPHMARLIVSASIALLVALNNLDFGIPSAVGVLACVLLFPPKVLRLVLPARIALAGVAFLLSALSTLGLYCLAIRIAAGAWPSLGHLTVYQSAFAMMGCFMLPMPAGGMHWLIYLTAVAALVVPIYETFSSNHDHISDRRRLINGGLAFSGLAAMGSMAYYVGRSHHHVLASTFFTWGYLLVQFMYRGWREWHDSSNRPRNADDFLLAVPLASTLGLCAIVPCMVLELPSVSGQVHRLTAKLPHTELPDSNLVELIRKHTRPNDKTVVAYRDAHWLALRAGVNNLFPFNHGGSLILKDQLNAVTAAVANLPAGRERFFGDPIVELRERLEDAGYKRVDGIADFGVWAKEPR